MALRKTTLKKLEHAAAVKREVELLFFDNEFVGSAAGEVINTILCEYLTTRECKELVLKVAIRNKGVRELISNHIKTVKDAN